MRIFFDASYVGSPTSFTWEDGNISVNDASGCDWRFESSGLRHKNVKAASEAAGLNLLIDPDVTSTKFWRKHTQNPAWSRIVSKEEYKIYLSTQIESVVSFLKDPKNQYFVSTFQEQQRLLDRLVNSRVECNALVEHGFVPGEGGFIPVPEYDNCHSATGRMTVVAGPKILTLQKDLRRHLRSRWSDGFLVEVDFNALDARVLGWIAGHQSPHGDMYEWIGEKSGSSKSPRAVIKEATLAAMYGMSRRNFAMRYQDMPDAVDVYEKVRSMLRVKDIESRLSSKPALANAFERPLPDTTAKVSYHVQSSAVDVSCCGFNWLVDRLDPKSCLPVFLIHDALVLDLKPEYLPVLQDICKDGLFVSIIDQSLPVRIRSFNDERK